MPDWLTTHRARPWHHVGHRVLRPFTAPEAKEIRGEHPDYCRHCQLYNTGRSEGRYEGSVYAYKVTCRRCGDVLRHGVYNQSGDQATGRRALEWATTPERTP